MFKEEKLKVFGKEIKILKENNESDKNIIYIHGAGCNGNIFMPLTKRLKQFNQVIINLPNREGIALDGLDTIEKCREYVLEICKQLKGYNILIGHSLGATIALNTRLTDADNKVIQKCIAVAGVISAEFITDKTLQVMGNEGVFKNIVMNELSNFSKMDIENLQDVLEKSLVNKDLRVTDFCIAKGYNGKKYIKNNKKYDVICISGDRDGIVIPSEQKKIQALLNCKVNYIENAGHFVICQESKLNDLANIIREYINK